MIVITILQASDGLEMAEANAGRRTFSEASRRGAIFQLARVMFAHRVKDQPWQLRGQNGAVRMSGPSIYAIARLTIMESEAAGPTLRRWLAYQSDASRCRHCRSERAVFRGRCLRCEWSAATAPQDAPAGVYFTGPAGSVVPEVVQ